MGSDIGASGETACMKDSALVPLDAVRANDQLLKESLHTTVIKASGQSLQDVTGMVFQLMRRQIFAEVGHPIIQLEAEEVYFDKVVKSERTERFLFLFWPRTRVTYEVTARVVVRVKYLAVEERR